MVQYTVNMKLPDGGILSYTDTRKNLCDKINTFVNTHYHIDANMHRNKFAALANNNEKCVSKYIRNIITIKRITPRNITQKNES